VTDNNIEEVINILNEAFKEKVFNIYFGKVSNIYNAPETFFTNIPYDRIGGMRIPQKVEANKSSDKIREICGCIIDFRTRGDFYHVYANRSIIVIADNGNIYLITLDKNLEEQQTTYEFKIAAA